MNTPANSHALETLGEHNQPEPRLGLSWLDRFAATSLVSGQTTGLEAWAVDEARALAGTDRSGARLRLLSRSLAITTAQVRTLEALLGQALARRDARGVDLVNRSLSAATRRLCRLAAEHRAETMLQQRPAVVAVGHACNVTIRAGG